jgi:hypothetical protein
MIPELLSPEDYELLTKINKHPMLKARFMSILKIAQSECEGCLTAHQAEDTVTENLRLLGNEVMHGWADTMETRVARKIKEEHPEYKLREKKTF